MSAPTTPRTFLTVDGLQVAHAVFGDDGAPVLALHGWGASVDLIAPLASRLANKGLRVYAPDLPGFGQTPPPPSAWGVLDYANFVLRYLDANELEKVHLFGHSFGGRLSLILGAEHAARIHKIVLADSAGVPPRRDPLADARLRLYKGVRDGLKGVGLSGLSEQLRGWYNQQYGSADFKSAGVLRDTFVKVVNENLLPYAARISAPTLLIWGEDDQDTPLWQGQQLEKTIPDAGLVVYENAGHYSYLDKLPEVIRTLEYFYTS
ncbi:MAG: alpha/beta hydrolase [Chloroflexota bacterium]|nr:alpha/beta hydrolase [Chloroflexota bacterium]